MRVYVINLDCSNDRLVEFRNTNGHLTDHVRFPAVDGRNLDIASLTQQGLVSADILNSYTIGAVGLAMSNKSLWQTAVEKNEVLTITEDDVIFHSQFETLAPEVIKALPPDWDLIFWGWNFDAFMIFDMLPGVSPCVAQFDQDKMRLSMRAFQQLSISPRAHRLIWSFGTSCYTVSPKGAQNLTSKCFPLKPMLIPWPQEVRKPSHAAPFPNFGLDATLNSLYRQLNAYVCFPPLVITKNEQAKSTIQRGGSDAVQSRSQKTLATSAQIPAIKPDDIAAFNRRGKELQKLNRLDEALAQYEKALILKPDDTATLNNCGSVLIDLRLFADALSSYDKLLSIRPNDFNALNMRGLALENLKRFEEALVSYDKAITVEPGSMEAFYNRGNVLADLGRLEDALTSYDKALEINPDAAVILNNRGLVLEELSRFEEALASYQMALKINPDYAAARENRGLLLEELERRRVSNPM